VDFNSIHIKERLERALDRAMLDFTSAADGQAPIAIIMHVEYIDGGMAAIKWAPKERASALVTLQRCSRHLFSYIDHVKGQVDALFKHKEQ
jgi:hypothetical protein